jgi:hypothetical protein
LLRLRGGAPSETSAAAGTGLIQRFQILNRAIERKRLELCPWEQFGIECEEAFAYQQVGHARREIYYRHPLDLLEHRPGYVPLKAGTGFNAQ